MTGILLFKIGATYTDKLELIVELYEGKV